jgi:hypothetical protein
VADFLFAIGTPRDNGLDAELAQKGAEAVAVIALVGEQLLDAGNETDAGFGLCAIGGISGCQNKNPWAAKLINNSMNLAVSAAFGQADSLNLRPPFPPPAQR